VLYEEAHGAYWVGAWVGHTALSSVKGRRRIYVRSVSNARILAPEQTLFMMCLNTHL